MIYAACILLIIYPTGFICVLVLLHVPICLRMFHSGNDLPSTSVSSDNARIFPDLKKRNENHGALHWVSASLHAYYSFLGLINSTNLTGFHLHNLVIIILENYWGKVILCLYLS